MVAGEGAPGFSRLSSNQTGLAFSNHVGIERLRENRLLEDGAGVACGDVDGDGWVDVFFCHTDGRSALYRNHGAWRFELSPGPWSRRAAAAGGRESPGPTQAHSGAAFADVDGDGDLDLLLASLGAGVALYLNDGVGGFVESADSGLQRRFGSRSLALADIDRDGDLDLYVANYRTTTVRDAPMRVRITGAAGRFEVPSEHRERFRAETTDLGQPVLIELGEPDVLYRNLGRGQFEAVSWTSGAFLDQEGRPLQEPPRDWGLSAMFRDLNGDGTPDLYVCNDFYSPDRIWLNDGAGRFRAIVAGAVRKTCWASMAVDVADIDRDGYDDIFVADMLATAHTARHVQRSLLETGSVRALGWGWGLGEVRDPVQVMRNTLLLHLGPGDYAEIGQLSGVQASDWTWSCAFLDVDLDGYEDLLIGNGHARDHLNSDLQATLPPPPAADASNAPTEKPFERLPPLHVAKRAFRNRGDLTFEDASARWRFDWSGICNGLCLADLDNDGDLDVVTNNLDATAGVFRNECPQPRILVRLRGKGANTRGIGARILVTGGPQAQSQEMVAGGRYLSSDEAARAFATLPGTRLRIEVIWPDGQRSVVPGAEPNRAYIIKQ
jgi:hypothetical protein